MTAYDKKSGHIAPAQDEPLDIELTLHSGSEVAEILDRIGEPATAVLRFTFENADPEILRALQQACERNGIEMQTAPAGRTSASGAYQDVTLPSDFKGKPN